MTEMIEPMPNAAQTVPWPSHSVIIDVSSGLAFVPLPPTPTYSAAKAAIRSFSESLRVQLAGISVQVIQLFPDSVRTTLLGQQDREEAMPLEDFLSEVMTLLRTQPNVKEVLVENVTFPRNAAANAVTTRSWPCSGNTAAHPSARASRHPPD